ncbi:GNAT family N-acetyltransferase [Salipaludibacillus keqinensis]|uniref:GNAT family N-acetyltransferase n=1 Tax=Salipaludibacillus keqinensis TaxID=2045207 RepID=A0A323TF16_9BACI|nr:GNAT family N-acetyltransferase [Salipaludibacillus keqinensis]PYZ93180.1 GNAT family N-acetyltransferase [Salipaludibacillus keqinensis]
MSTVKELRSQEEIETAFPIMRQLRNHLEEKTYVELVLEAQIKEQYRLFALYENDKIVAVIGFMPMITLYNGRFIWICDLVTDEKQRSIGYGEKLLRHVEQWAKDHKYHSVALSSGIQRTTTHRFYEEKMDYERVSYVYQKSLVDTEHKDVQ